MNAQRDGNGGYWMSAIIAVILILAAIYWWRDDLGRWLGGTPSVETGQTNASQTDQPEGDGAPPVEQSATPPEATDAPVSTD